MSAVADEPLTREWLRAQRGSPRRSGSYGTTSRGDQTVVPKSKLRLLWECPYCHARRAWGTSFPVYVVGTEPNGAIVLGLRKKATILKFLTCKGEISMETRHIINKPKANQARVNEETHPEVKRVAVDPQPGALYVYRRKSGKRQSNVRGRQTAAQLGLATMTHQWLEDQ